MALERSQHLSVLDLELIEKILNVVTIKTYEEGEVVISKFTVKGSKMWIVLMGSL